MAVTPYNQGTTGQHVVDLTVLNRQLTELDRVEALSTDTLRRLERAFILLRRPGAVRPSRNTACLYHVSGDSNAYIVFVAQDYISCNCPDYREAGQLCKHCLAVILYRRFTGRGATPPAAARHVAVPDAAVATAALNARVWLTPLGAAEAARLPSLWELLTRDFQRVDAALWRHHARTGHTHHDCAAMRWADRLWRELAHALDRALERQGAHGA